MTGLVSMQTDDLMQLFVIEDFLPYEECDSIANLARRSLRPSTLFGPNDGYRTSSTSDLGPMRDRRVEAVDKLIADTLGLPLALAEGTQAQCYGLGEEFKLHTDYFDDEETVALSGGQRTWTFMVYLNDDFIGGETAFPLIGEVFKPQKGMAVVWNNLLPDGAPKDLLIFG